MMRAALDEMRESGAREVELDVAAMRADAIGLYSRLGFERTRSYLNLAATGRELGLDRIDLPPSRSIGAATEMELVEGSAAAQATEPLLRWDRTLASLLA